MLNRVINWSLYESEEALAPKNINSKLRQIIDVSCYRSGVNS